MTTLKTLRLAAVAVLLAAPAAFAQNTPPPPAGASMRPTLPTDTAGLQVDRIAAVVGDRPILWTEVMEEINERRARMRK